MTGYFELQADRHADEQGQIDRIEHQVEKAWDRERGELIAMLAMGKPLTALGKPLLDFIDVRDRMAEEHDKAQDACFILSATHPDLAGHHMKKLVEQVAEELVDLFADDLRADIQRDIAA